VHVEAALEVRRATLGPEHSAVTGFALAKALWDVRQPEPARQGALRARARFALLEKPQQVEELDTWLESRTQEELRPSRQKAGAGKKRRRR